MAIKDIYVDLETWIDQVRKREDFALSCYVTSVFANIAKVYPEILDSKFAKYPYTISFLESQIRKSQPTVEEMEHDVTQVIEYVRNHLAGSENEAQDLFPDLINKDLDECKLTDLSMVISFSKENTSFQTAFPLNSHMPIFVRGYNFENYWVTRIAPFNDTRLPNNVYDTIRDMPVIVDTRRTIAIPYRKEDTIIAIRRPELGKDAFALFVNRENPAPFTENTPNFLGNTAGTDEEIMEFVSDLNKDIRDEKSTIYPFKLDQ